MQFRDDESWWMMRERGREKEETDVLDAILVREEEGSIGTSELDVPVNSCLDQQLNSLS
jgi:hypothetical protein